MESEAGALPGGEAGVGKSGGHTLRSLSQKSELCPAGSEKARKGLKQGNVLELLLPVAA